MRPRLCAIGHKVNPFLNASPFHSCETWLLLQARTLCILRYTQGDNGEPKDQGQVCAGAKEEEGRRVCCYSCWTSGHVPDIRPSPDIRPNTRNPAHFYPKSTSVGQVSPDIRPGPGHPAPPASPDIRHQPGNPAPITERPEAGSRLPGHPAQRPDIRRLGKARTSGPSPGHPAPSVCAQ